MTQAERRIYLIKYLLIEQASEIRIPNDAAEQKLLLRGLLNVRPPMPASNEFIAVQDEYLKEEIKRSGITDYKTLSPIADGIYLWQGDITTLKCGAIVNAANSKLLGCFCPNHRCIDNAIHTLSGVQLRLACNELMEKQSFDEPTGKAKITPAFNLPCQKVIHTVGPIVYGRLTEKDCDLLRSCYLSCLEIAENDGVKSIAFCCISTGEFHFPNDKAAEIAIKTVKEYKKRTGSRIEVVFNVFKDRDKEIYRKLLTQN